MSPSQINDDNHSNRDTIETLIAFIRLFLNIINREDFISELKTKQVNSNALLQLSRNHKCNPIILHTIRINRLGQLLPNLTNRLQNIVKMSTAHNKNLWAEFVHFSKQLDKKNIDYVIYKGVPFAQQFYSSSTLRHSVDVDMGMALKDIPKAAEILFSHGYEDYKNIIDYKNISNSRAYHIDFSYVKRNHEGQILYNIELHWQAAHHVLQMPYAFDKQIHQKVKLKIGNDSVSTLSKIELTILMLIHHGLVDVWGKLRHLVDLHFVLDTLNEEEMELLRIRLKELKLTKCFELGCQQLEILKQDREQDEFWKLIMSGDLSKNWSDYRPKLMWHLKMRETYLERLKVILSLAFFKFKFTKE